MAFKITSLILGFVMISGIVSNTYAQTETSPLAEGIKKYHSHLFKDALAYFDQALQQEPNKLALDYKGVSLMKLQRYSDAVIHYESLVKNYPKDTAALNNLGIALGSLDRHADAIIRFNQVLQINSNDITALQGMGVSYGNLGEYGDSLYYFKMAQEIDPKNIVTKNYVEYSRLIIDKYYPKFNTEQPWTVQQKSVSQIPSWVKNNALWWSEDKISESDFLSGIEYLVNHDIIQVQQSSKTESSKNVPKIKTTQEQRSIPGNPYVKILSKAKIGDATYHIKSHICAGKTSLTGATVLIHSDMEKKSMPIKNIPSGICLSQAYVIKAKHSNEISMGLSIK